MLAFFLLCKLGFASEQSSLIMFLLNTAFKRSNQIAGNVLTQMLNFEKKKNQKMGSVMLWGLHHFHMIDSLQYLYEKALK